MNQYEKSLENPAMVCSRIIAAAATVLLAGGCASVTSLAGAHYQSISVQTSESDRGDVTGALCELTNRNGKWFVTTPGSVMISGSNDDLQVVCKKPDHEPGSATVVSAIKPAMVGNVLIGGAIGAIVDHVDGSAYAYPEQIQISMGASSRIETSRLQDQPAQPEASATTTVTLLQNSSMPQKAIQYSSYTLLPSGVIVEDKPAAIRNSKAIPVKAAMADSGLKKKRGDACDMYVTKGEMCWWSPPGNYSMCPLIITFDACKAAFGNGCQLGHGKLIPLC